MLLTQTLQSYNVILASGSPRRQELMSAADMPFRVAEKYHVDEIYPNELPPHKVPQYLSELKSQHYPKTLAQNEILITADTVVIIDNQVIGKPKPNKAFEMLSLLNGRTHTVVTGVTIRTSNRLKSFSNTSKVTFQKLTDEELSYYTKKYSPYDKAGAYGIQEWIGCVGIKSIEGSFYNVMGLPIHELYQELKNFI